jgi:orotate phosphoribosyltransferase
MSDSSRHDPPPPPLTRLPDDILRRPMPRRSPASRQDYATYFNLAQLGRDILSVALLRAPDTDHPFVLRSGQLSEYYLDKYEIATRPDLLDRVAFALGDLILHGLPGNPSGNPSGNPATHPARRPTRLAGIELGSVPITIATSLEIGIPSIIIRRVPKVYGPKAVQEEADGALTDRGIAASMIEGRLDPIDSVVLIEDIVTTGFELIRGTRILRNFGISPATIYAVAVVDREEGAAKAFADEGIPFVSLFTRTSLGL